MVHKWGKGVKNVQKKSTWFMTQIIAFRDVTAKFYDMGLRTMEFMFLVFKNKDVDRKIFNIYPSHITEAIFQLTYVSSPPSG